MDNVIKYEKLVTKIASKYSNYTDFEDLRNQFDFLIGELTKENAE